MEKTNKKKILSAISLCISAAIFIMAVSVFIISLNARKNNRPAQFFGYSFAIVVTDSMSPEINVGDMILVKSCSIDEVSAGQNAVFMGIDGDYKDKCIVHRVIQIDQADDGSIQLITKGIHNADKDPDAVTSANFLGVQIYSSAAWGSVLRFFQSPINWLYMLVIAAAVFVAVTQTIKIVKAVKSKKQESKKGD